MLPIVFIHAGTSPYLPITLLQVAHASPGSRRVLLGDGGSWQLGQLAERAPMAHFWRRATVLGQTFVNLSTNASDFELVCLQRWCCLLEWMEHEKVEQCLYLDSDVLLYQPAEVLATTLPPHTGMTVAGISAHTNFVMDRAILAAFCDHILNAYASASAIAALREEYRVFSLTNAAGGISDMSFLSSFRDSHPGAVADISSPQGGTAFDITINYTAHYEADTRGLKRISWQHGLPYAHQIQTGEPVQMATLHFQGASKAYIDEYATFPKGRLPRWRAINKVGGLVWKAFK